MSININSVISYYLDRDGSLAAPIYLPDQHSDRPPEPGDPPELLYFTGLRLGELVRFSVKEHPDPAVRFAWLGEAYDLARISSQE